MADRSRNLKVIEKTNLAERSHRTANGRGRLRIRLNFSVSKVLERQANSKITCPQSTDDFLQVVSFASRYAHLAILKSRLNLQSQCFNGLRNLLGLVPLETLLDGEFLSRMAKRRDVGIPVLDIAQVNPALGKLADDNLAQPFEPRTVVHREEHRACFGIDLNRCPHAFEIEPGGQLTLGLIDRIPNLHAIHFGDDVKGWHKSKLSQLSRGCRSGKRRSSSVIYPSAGVSSLTDRYPRRKNFSAVVVVFRAITSSETPRTCAICSATSRV